MQEIEAFRSIAAVFQSVAVVVAVLIGGFWTAYVFRLQRRSVLEIEISGKQLEIPGDDYLHILVEVTISNRGNQETRLVWSPQPVSVSKVTMLGHGIPSLERVGTGPILFMDESGEKAVEVSAGIRAGHTKHYQVVMVVETAGLYQLTFMAQATPEQITDSTRAIGLVIWKAMSHIVVQESRPVDSD